MQQFLPRDAIHSVVFAVVRCPSAACLFVCLSRCIVSKRLNLTIKFFHRLVAPSFAFEFRRGHPQQGRQTEVAGVRYQKFAIFNQYFTVSETMRDRP